VSKGEYNSSKVSVHPALACLLVKRYTQEKRNIKMKINKKLIVSILELYKLDIVNREIKEHDQSLELLIKVNEQIKLVKEWKK